MNLQAQVQNLTAILDLISDSPLDDIETLQSAIDRYDDLKPLLEARKESTKLLTNADMVDLLRPSGYIDRILSLFTTPTFEHTQTLSRVRVTLTSLKKDLKSLESQLKTAKATSNVLNTPISSEYRRLLQLKGYCYKTEAKRHGFDYEVCLFEKAVQMNGRDEECKLATRQ